MPAFLPARRRPALLCCAAALLAGCSTDPYKPATLESLRTPEGWYRFPGYNYRGAVANGRPNGEGEVRYYGGVTVRGRFADGVPVGPAVVEVSDWGRIEGRMSGGQLVDGTAVLRDGTRYRGGFRDWQFSGAGLLVTADDRRMRGTFASGRLEGPGIVFDARTGTLTEGRFSGGQPTGEAFVDGPGGARLAHYEGGRDVAAERIRRTIAERETRAASAEIERQMSEVRRANERAAQLEAQRARLASARTPAGIQKYNEECGCLADELQVQPDGSLVRSSKFCLMVSDSRRSAEQKRLDSIALAERTRACAQWRNDSMDPNVGARAEAAYRALDANNRARDAARQAQLRAEDERRRLELEMQARRYRESIEAEARRAEAENAAAAARRRAAHQRRCESDASYRGCFCGLMKGTASCQ